ncbi:E3 ubiquitin-protein ligase RNF38-like [Sardina pilchardus]|uniref:E3 ubiquitin-protein ligase RNF38-like n=1 Tax=Sardina pilchardus TaxID=27697 RepID=UPI002E162B6A
MGRKRKRSSGQSSRAVYPNSSYYLVSSWDFDPSAPGTFTATTFSRHTDLEYQLRAEPLFLLRGDVILEDEDSLRPKRSRPARSSVPTSGRRSPQPGTSRDPSAPGTDPLLMLSHDVGSPQPGTSRDQQRARSPLPPWREIPAVTDEGTAPLTLITDFPADREDLPDSFSVTHMGPPYIEFEFNLVDEEVTIWQIQNNRPQNVPFDLPTMLFNPENATEQSDCRICLASYAEGEELTTLPCSHRFHSTCGNAWLRQNPTCPMCRAPVSSAN